MPIEYTVHVLRRPYRDTIPDDAFDVLLDDAVGARARDVNSRHGAGEYQRDCMAFAILDPTAPSAARADDIVLALALVGAGADFFAPNALAKVFCLRDHGLEGSALVITQTHRLADGSFRHGGAVEVAGTLVGASGQTELQDRHQCTMLAADFNYAVGAARQRWESDNGPGRWYLREQAADARFRMIVARALTPSDT